MWMVVDVIGYVAYCFIYLVYRAIYYIVRSIQYLTCPEMATYAVCAHVMSIRWRRKLFLIDVVSPYDFIALHELYTTPEYVMKSNVSLYCITEDEAIFVETPESINIFRTDVNPFQYIGQFRHATKIIRMPMTSLCRLAATIGDPTVDMSYLANTGRCGSTLLSKAIERVPGTLIHAEPDCLTNLGHLWKGKLISQTKYEHVLIAIFRFLGKPCPGVRRVCIKPRSCGVVHINAIAKHFPMVKLMFGYRNSRDTVSSFLGLMLSETAQSSAMYLINSDLFSSRIPFLRQRMFYYFCYIMTREQPLMNPKRMNAVEMFTYAWAICVNWCRDFQKSGGDIFPIRYEEMINNKHAVLEGVLSELGIDTGHVQDALHAFTEDSQAGSVLSRAAIINSHRRKISDSDKGKADKILDKYNIPPLGCTFVIGNDEPTSQ